MEHEIFSSVIPYGKQGIHQLFLLNGKAICQNYLLAEIMLYSNNSIHIVLLIATVATVMELYNILYSGLLSRGNIFTIFTNWTQFVPCETLFIESLISMRVQLFVKIILIKCDSTVHSRNISASKITH